MGEVPRIDLAKWDLRIFGQVENPLTFTWEELQALPRTEVHCDIHCVTRWSRLDNTFSGVPFREISTNARNPVRMSDSY